MTERMTLGEIREHWEEAGRGFAGDEAITPTTRDPYLGALERENVLAHLPEGASVLEVGCGDGAHTVSYARKASRMTALDLAESLIDLARGVVVPFDELLEEMLGLVSEDAEALGCTREVAGVRDILTRGTSAHRQLWDFVLEQAAGKSVEDRLKAVVDTLISDTAEGL